MLWSPPITSGVHPVDKILVIACRINGGLAWWLYGFTAMSPTSATRRDSNGAAPVAGLYGWIVHDSSRICLGPSLWNKQTNKQKQKTNKRSKHDGCLVRPAGQSYGRKSKDGNDNCQWHYDVRITQFNPFTPELKKCILPTFQKAIVWVM